MAEALRFQSQLPLTFWKENMLTAVYLINRLNISSFQKISFYEIRYNQPRAYNHVKGVLGVHGFPAMSIPK